MPTLDMSDMMSDPDFAQEFTYLRRYENVDLKGRSQWFSKPNPGIGIIQPLTGQTLRQMPSLAAIDGVIEIWTALTLQTLTKDTKPDIICFGGNHYLVTAIPGDWQYIGGFRRYVGTLHELEAEQLQDAP
jgi:hypothetical protein